MFRRWEPVDLVVGVIALTICIILFFRLCIMGYALVKGIQISEEANQRFVSVVASMVAIILMWVGYRVGKKSDPPDNPNQEASSDAD